MDREEELLAEFRALGAIRQGHFRLTSGLHSDTFFQLALVLSDPARAARVLSPLAQRWKGQNVTCVAGPAVKGILVAYELARQLGCRAVYAEREGGNLRLRRGFELTAADGVLLVDDVVSTGVSLLEAERLIRATGARLAGIAAILDRTGGSAGFSFDAVVRLGGPPAWKPEACPLCREGLPLEAPGSRHLA